jgi:hypothetical protein
MKSDLNDLVRTMMASGPYEAGYIKNTDPWRLKFHRPSEKQQRRRRR